MYPDPNMDAVLFEIEQRRGQAALERRAGSCNATQMRPAARLLWAIGSSLLRAGTLLAGDEGRLHSDTADGG